MELITITAVISLVLLLFSMGGNNAANIIGVAVGSRIISYRKAVMLAGIAVVVGAFLEGHKISSVTATGIIPQAQFDHFGGFIVLLATAFWTFVATRKGWPVSVSQGIIGSIVGYGLAIAAPVQWEKIYQIVIAIILNPFIAAFISFTLYITLDRLLKKKHVHHKLWNIPILLSSTYIGYTLGANTLSGTIGVAIGSESLSSSTAIVIGSIAMVAGIVIFGYKVIKTVGFSLTDLSPMAAFLAQLAAALTVHLFIELHIPTSITYATVGGVMGIGLTHTLKSMREKGDVTNLWGHIREERRELIKDILLAWIGTPLLTGSFVFLITVIVQQFAS